MAHEIIIDVPLKGPVSVTVSGVKGKGCKALTADFEKELGSVTKDALTKEYHESEARIVLGSKR